MVTLKEARSRIQSLGNMPITGRRASKTADIIDIIESEGYAVPEAFQKAIEEANLVYKNLTDIQAAGQPDLFDAAHDPKKFQQALDNIARAKALDHATRTEVLQRLRMIIDEATVRSVPELMDQFIEQHKDTTAFLTEGGTPGEILLAQEKRVPLTELHRRLIVAGAGGQQPDTSETFWLHWSWTPEQWAQVPGLYPRWEVPSIDEAAQAVGATFRWARSLEQIADESEGVIEYLAALEAEEKAIAANPWNVEDRPRVSPWRKVSVD